VKLVRVRFTKLGKVRFTSHRDVARIWERTIRKAGLPVAYSEGFSPRPKLAFGLALSTGHESMAEFLDIALRDDADTEPLAIEDLPERLSPHLPEGMDVTAAAELAPGTLSLQESVTSSSWRIEVPDLAPATASQLVAAALAADTLVVTRTRKGKDVVDDVRPGIISVSVTGPTAGGTELEAELAVHPRSVRPAELLAALGPALSEGRVLRTAQWTWRDDTRCEPLVPARRPREDPHVRPRSAAPEHPEPAGADLLVLPG
jgi:radical SAM-linked protein